MLVEMSSEDLMCGVFGAVVSGDISIRGIFKLVEYTSAKGVQKLRLTGRLMKPFKGSDGKPRTKFIKLGVNVSADLAKLNFEDIIDDMQLALQKEVYHQLSTDEDESKAMDFELRCCGQIIVQYYQPNGQIPKLVQNVLTITSACLSKQDKLAHYELTPFSDSGDYDITEKDIDLIGKSSVGDSE